MFHHSSALYPQYRTNGILFETCLSRSRVGLSAHLPYVKLADEQWIKILNYAYLNVTSTCCPKWSYIELSRDETSIWLPPTEMWVSNNESASMVSWLHMRTRALYRERQATFDGPSLCGSCGFSHWLTVPFQPWQLVAISAVISCPCSPHI